MKNKPKHKFDAKAIDRLAARIARGLFTVGGNTVHAERLKSFDPSGKWMGADWAESPMADFIAAEIKKAVL